MGSSAQFQPGSLETGQEEWLVVLFGTVAYSSAQLETGNGEWVVLFVTAAYSSDLLLIGS